MMTALPEAPDQVAQSREWYSSRLAGLDLGNTDDRKAAIAFLAAEGAFLLKAFGLIDMGDSDWKLLFDDMIEMTGGASNAEHGRGHDP